ncbi:hypothetical protein SAMN04489859_100891 [Paracoccus alcaliphilus]|uniref:Uncharacterized protein n=1 Tax=Paracoccus alcaliphilus TaxID=34002 RepID=A0A1H8H292_9RHOB|nr:hypothetical protein [Paracoccus alcaliphilus]WCR17403.1 hypothetical protein JHW40_13780 [Paracoccus alcaliphilus]SEN50521.1 hypothetical protein SAMN04489859_100891 [Paracoccus alcaliphilus]
MTRIDPLNATIWIGGLIFAAAVWAFAIWGAFDIGSRVIPWLFQDAGTLTGCEALNAADCVAFAQGGL